MDEELLLALLNSTPVVDGHPRDDLADLADLAGLAGDDEVERAAVRRARDLLQDVVRGLRPAGDLAPLLDGVARVPELDDTATGGADLRWHLAVPEGRGTVVRAVLAWAELTSALPGRLRPCGNDECRLFFVDRSRAGTGRWCSMAVCGNRMKARRHQARGRTGAR